MSAQDEESVVPEFAHAVRGYDRYQVDEYIERLNEWAGEAQARALEAERRAAEQAEEIRALRDRLADMEDGGPATPDHALKAAADRAADSVAAAVRHADDIRRRAAADAEHRLEEASRQAVAIVEAARQSVAGLAEEVSKERREARRRLETMIEEAHQQAEEIARRAADVTDTAAADARTEAARIVAAAEADAAEMRARSEEERGDAEGAVQRLKTERAEIMEELQRLRGAIQSLLSGPPSVAPAERDPGVAPDPSAPGEPTVVIDTTALASASGDSSDRAAGPSVDAG